MVGAQECRLQLLEKNNRENGIYVTFTCSCMQESKQTWLSHIDFSELMQLRTKCN